MSSSAGALLLSCPDGLLGAPFDCGELTEFFDEMDVVVEIQLLSGLTWEFARDSIASFFQKDLQIYFLCGIFHGDESGEWQLADKLLGYWDVASEWRLSGNSCEPDKHLLILADSCYSGRWVHQALGLKLRNVSVQASCGPSYTCSDGDSHFGSFSTYWADIQRKPPQDEDESDPWLDRLQPLYTKCRDVVLKGKKLMFVGSTSDKTEKLSIRIMKRSDRSGFFTEPVLHAYQSSFDDIWSGKFRLQEMQERQGKLFLDLMQKGWRENDEDLIAQADAIRVLLKMQLVSDMTTLAPDQGCSDPKGDASGPQSFCHAASYHFFNFAKLLSNCIVDGCTKSQLYTL